MQCYAELCFVEIDFVFYEKVTTHRLKQTNRYMDSDGYSHLFVLEAEIIVKKWD